MNKLVLATGNQKKVKELAAMLADMKIQVIPQSEFAVSDADETGTTFVENAIIKARHAARITGLPAVADVVGVGDQVDVVPPLVDLLERLALGHGLRLQLLVGHGGQR